MPRSRHRHRYPALLAAALAVTGGCAPGFRAAKRSPGQPAFYALLLNGGHSPRVNYVSHVLHIAEMHQVLRARGVPAEQISVLMSDGDDPAADVAMEKRAAAPGAWLLDGTYLERPLGRPIQYRDTNIPKVTAMPATRKELATWFRDAAGGGIQPGDTLLFFVTDHGQRGKNPQDTSILLWQQEKLTVKELAPFIAQLPRGARVVTVMSQCYSGAFAELALAPPANRAVGDTCGFFSTSPDLEAYGCSPSSSASPAEGHAMSFIAGLRQSSSLAAAHASALVTDRTPDAPNRTSDVFLARVVARVAAERGLSSDQLVSSPGWRRDGQRPRRSGAGAPGGRVVRHPHPGVRG